MDFADAELAVIILSCIFVGIQSMDDDVARAGACFEMGKCGMYGKLINLLDAARFPSASDGCLFLFTLAAEHLVWCLNKDSLVLPTSKLLCPTAAHSACNTQSSRCFVRPRAALE